MAKHALRFLVLRAAFGLAFGWVGLAEAHGEDTRGTLTVTAENDVISGEDRHYTNGLRVAYVTAPVRATAFEEALMGPGTLRRSFAAGQTIFTPEDIFSAVPAVDEHPYAGFLFGEVALLNERRGRWDLLTVQAGVIGPSALGEATQNWFHRRFNFVEAEGWDTQRPDEVAVNIAYDWKGRPLLAFDGPLSFELTPTAGASAGTVSVNARGGAMARIGQRLTSDFGPARIRPSLTGSGHFPQDHRTSWYLFAGAQVRAVAYDTFIDGSMFHGDESTITKEPLVYDGQAGLAVQLGRAQVSWTFVHRSERFEQQEDADQFAALSLSLKL